MNFSKLGITIAVVLATTAAKAESFEYSYTFLNGSVIAGSFEGTANGNLVTNLSHITASLNGHVYNGSGNLLGSFLDIGASTSSGFAWVPGAAVVSFNGQQNNFLFNDGISPYSGFTNYVYIASESIFAYISTGLYQQDNYNASRWTLTSVSAVPEPEALTMLLAGLGLMGTVARRRQRKNATV